MPYSRTELFALCATLLLAGKMSIAADTSDKIEFAIALHGGAGLDPEKLSAEQQARLTAALGGALEVGRTILAAGGTALDAVERTIRVLEDDPLFNAGRGAVFNSEGKHELDASIMDGHSGQAGAVGSVTTIKNPISLARLVMTKTRHLLLVGDGAEKFADEMRSNSLIERVPNSYFDTDQRRQEWLKAVENEKRMPSESQTQSPDKPGSESKSPERSGERGTVGCVALDAHGNLAAGTSTGGLTNKKWGRVGDSPIIGAGTYADSATCAVSCTGTGEHFIRNSVAFHVAALMAYKRLSLDAAVLEIFDRVLPPDAGGLIAVDHQGHISLQTNTTGMSRASTDSSGRLEIKLAR